jgi:hypothetical protein
MPTLQTVNPALSIGHFRHVNTALSCLIEDKGTFVNVYCAKQANYLPISVGDKQRHIYPI